jgi:hypothetical protein
MAEKPELEFEPFQKIARFFRDVVISEKIDGTNGCVYITDDGDVFAASRSRWITPQDDNYGFARWVAENADGLRGLGAGRHFGEWWGSGIQRNYSQTRKRFSLFNVAKWGDERPECCDVVPVLYRGPFTPGCVHAAVKKLRDEGSMAAPGFMKPEGIILWHEAAQQLFKVTLEKDEAPKSVVRERAEASA